MINKIRMGLTSMADTKSVVQNSTSSLKHGMKGRWERNYKINMVEFILCL